MKGVKNYWFFTVCLLLAAGADAQHSKTVEAVSQQYNVPELSHHLTGNNVCFTDAALDKFTGSWLAQKGDSLFKLSLVKETRNIRTLENPLNIALLEGYLTVSIRNREFEDNPPVLLFHAGPLINNDQLEMQARCLLPDENAHAVCLVNYEAAIVHHKLVIACNPLQDTGAYPDTPVFFPHQLVLQKANR